MKLNKIYTSNMVFPAGKEIVICGTGQGNAEITFNGIVKAFSPEREEWKVYFPPMEYGGPYELTFTYNDKKTVLENIYVGEVFLMAGQSNMHFRLKGSSTPKEEWKSNKMLRLFAADRMEKSQMEELRQVSNSYNEAVKEGNMEAMIKHDTRFHHIIVESCRNKILVQMIEQLQELVLRFRYIYYDNFKRAENMPEEHEAIVAAIAEGDADKARAAADIHIERLKELVIKEGVHQRHV